MSTLMIAHGCEFCAKRRPQDSFCEWCGRRIKGIKLLPERLVFYLAEDAEREQAISVTNVGLADLNIKVSCAGAPEITIAPSEFELLEGNSREVAISWLAREERPQRCELLFDAEGDVLAAEVRLVQEPEIEFQQCVLTAGEVNGEFVGRVRKAEQVTVLSAGSTEPTGDVVKAKLTAPVTAQGKEEIRIPFKIEKDLPAQKSTIKLELQIEHLGKRVYEVLLVQMIPPELVIVPGVAPQEVVLSLQSWNRTIRLENKGDGNVVVKSIDFDASDLPVRIEAPPAPFSVDREHPKDVKLALDVLDESFPAGHRQVTLKVSTDSRERPEQECIFSINLKPPRDFDAPIAFDFGTNSSTAAYYLKNVYLPRFESGTGEYYIPSGLLVRSWPEKSGGIIGDEAKSKAAKFHVSTRGQTGEPTEVEVWEEKGGQSSYLLYIKRGIGQLAGGRVEFSAGGESMNAAPEELASLVIANLKRQHEARFGERIREVFATVPTSFLPPQKDKIREAFARSGLQIKGEQLVDESLAAGGEFFSDPQKMEALRARTDKDEFDVIVLDIGGGTSDATLFRVKDKVDGPQVISILGCAGHRRFGGDAVTRKVADRVRRTMLAQAPSTEPDAGSNFAAEDLKVQLSLLADSLSRRVPFFFELHEIVHGFEALDPSRLLERVSKEFGETAATDGEVARKWLALLQESNKLLSRERSEELIGRLKTQVVAFFPGSEKRLVESPDLMTMSKIICYAVLAPIVEELAGRWKQEGVARLFDTEAVLNAIFEGEIGIRGVSMHDLIEAHREGLDRLLREIQVLLEACGCAKDRVDAMVLSGQAAKFPNIAHFFRKNLSCEIELLPKEAVVQGALKLGRRLLEFEAGTINRLWFRVGFERGLGRGWPKFQAIEFVPESALDDVHVQKRRFAAELPVVGLIKLVTNRAELDIYANTSLVDDNIAGNPGCGLWKSFRTTEPAAQFRVRISEKYELEVDTEVKGAWVRLVPDQA